MTEPRKVFSGGPSSHGQKAAPPPAQTFSVTTEAVEVLKGILEVQETEGRDARKARKLAYAAFALLDKMSQKDVAIKFYMNSNAMFTKRKGEGQ